MKMMIAAVLMSAGLLMLGGCEKRLFVENLPRTQFERYDRLRGNYVPTEKRDQYGRYQPALRERLQPPL